MTTVLLTRQQKSIILLNKTPEINGGSIGQSSPYRKKQLSQNKLHEKKEVRPVFPSRPSILSISSDGLLPTRPDIEKSQLTHLASERFSAYMLMYVLC